MRAILSVSGRSEVSSLMVLSRILLNAAGEEKELSILACIARKRNDNTHEMSSTTATSIPPSQFCTSQSPSSISPLNETLHQASCPPLTSAPETVQHISNASLRDGGLPLLMSKGGGGILITEAELDVVGRVLARGVVG